MRYLGKPRSLIAAAIACALAIPVGYAAAQGLGGDAEAPYRVPIAECPEVQAAFEAVGSSVETVSYPCPDTDQAAAAAEEFNKIRRNGLTHILKGMRAHDASAEEMAPIETELEQLGGPYVHPEGETP